LPILLRKPSLPVSEGRLAGDDIAQLRPEMPQWPQKLPLRAIVHPIEPNVSVPEEPWKGAPRTSFAQYAPAGRLHTRRPECSQIGCSIVFSGFSVVRHPAGAGPNVVGISRRSESQRGSVLPFGRWSCEGHSLDSNPRPSQGAGSPGPSISLSVWGGRARLDLGSGGIGARWSGEDAAGPYRARTAPRGLPDVRFRNSEYSVERLAVVGQTRELSLSQHCLEDRCQLLPFPRGRVQASPISGSALSSIPLPDGGIAVGAEGGRTLLVGPDGQVTDAQAVALPRDAQQRALRILRTRLCPLRRHRGPPGPHQGIR